MCKQLTSFIDDLLDGPHSFGVVGVGITGGLQLLPAPADITSHVDKTTTRTCVMKQSTVNLWFSNQHNTMCSLYQEEKPYLCNEIKKNIVISKKIPMDGFFYI